MSRALSLLLTMSCVAFLILQHTKAKKSVIYPPQQHSSVKCSVPKEQYKMRDFYEENAKLQKTTQIISANGGMLSKLKVYLPLEHKTEVIEAAEDPLPGLHLLEEKQSKPLLRINLFTNGPNGTYISLLDTPIVITANSKSRQTLDFSKYITLAFADAVYLQRTYLTSEPVPNLVSVGISYCYDL